MTKLQELVEAVRQAIKRVEATGLEMNADGKMIKAALDAYLAQGKCDMCDAYRMESVNWSFCPRCGRPFQAEPVKTTLTDAVRLCQAPRIEPLDIWWDGSGPVIKGI
jgi:predicted amidophosphoribosyltransferase